MTIAEVRAGGCVSVCADVWRGRYILLPHKTCTRGEILFDNGVRICYNVSVGCGSGVRKDG